MQQPGRADFSDSYQVSNDDEIDLFELIEGLWRRRLLIALVTGGAVLLALVYVLLIAKPTYFASGLVRPPADSSLAAVNEAAVLTLDAEQAFTRVVHEARSRDTQWEVFLSNREDLLGHWPPNGRSAEDVFVEQFLPAVSISIGGTGKTDLFSESTLTAGFRHQDPEYSAVVANALMEAANRRATETLLTEVRTALNTRILLLEKSLAQAAANLKAADINEVARIIEEDNLRRLVLEDRISSLRSQAGMLRKDRIKQLEEALATAKSLGIEEPTSLAILARERSGESQSVSVAADLSRGDEPDYLRGTRMLSAEITSLRARENDDFMIPELRELEAELLLLENNRRAEILAAREDYSVFVDGDGSIRAEIAELRGYLDADYENLLLSRVDQQAIPPRRPEKPRKALIVAAALIAGGMLGVLIALMLNAAEARRRQQKMPDMAGTASTL